MREHDERSVIEIYAGSLDEPNQVAIEDHVWASRQLSWLKVDDDLPRYPGRKPSA